MATRIKVVTNNPDNSPIVSAQVQITKILPPAFEQTGFTSAWGYVWFNDLFDGEYLITPTKDRYTFTPLTKIGGSATGSTVGEWVFIGVIPILGIANLNIGNIKTYGMTLNWTAQVDAAASIRTVTIIDIRYSTAPITNENWNNAIAVLGEPAPLPAGTPQNMAITILSPDTLYYWGIKTIDNVGNISELSNVVSARTDILPPAYPDPPVGGLPPITYFIRMSVDMYEVSKHTDYGIYLLSKCQIIFVTDETLPIPDSITASLYSGDTQIKNATMRQTIANKHSWGGRYINAPEEIGGTNPLWIVRCRRPLLRFIKDGVDFLNLKPIKIDRQLMKDLQYKPTFGAPALDYGKIQNESIRIDINKGIFKILFTHYGNILKSGSVKVTVYNSDAQGSIGTLRGTYRMNCLSGNYYQTDNIDIGTGQIAYFLEAQTVNLHKFNEGQYYL